MVNVFYDLYFRAGEDSVRHRPSRRNTAISAVRVAWYEANEDAQPLLRAAYEMECRTVEELAQRLECSYLPHHAGDDLMEEQSVAPILIIACIAAAGMERRALNATNFDRPRLPELPPDIHPACIPRRDRIPAHHKKRYEPVNAFVVHRRAN